MRGAPILMSLGLLAALPGCTARGGGGGAGGGGETNAISIASMQAFLVADYDCEPNADGVVVLCADYDVELVLHNDGPDDNWALTGLRFELGDIALEANTDCSDRPWQVSAGSDSSLVEIAVRYDGVGGVPTMYHRCGGEQIGYSQGGLGPAPLEGTVIMTLHGETTAADTWDVEETAELQDPAG